MKKIKEPLFRGVATALVTPFKDTEIDYPALARLIEDQISAGVGALVIGGTTGEAATLSELERYKLFEYSMQRADKRVKIILGTGTNDTKMALERTKFAKSLGADGALVVTPYYNKGTEEGIFRHYSLIADEADIPIILYNVPSRTGVNLGLHLLERLSEHPRIVGLKEAGDSTDRLVALAQFRDTLPLYAGNDSQIYPTLALGGVGVISVVSNILPRLSAELCTTYFEGRHDRALDLQLKLLPLIRALFLETNPAPAKYAMSLLGRTSAELRLPLAEVRESTKDALKKELSEFFPHLASSWVI